MESEGSYDKSAHIRLQGCANLKSRK